MDYVKHHAKSLQKGSKEYEYVGQKLAWSGVYLWGTFSNDILQKVQTLVPLIATIDEVFFANMTTFLFYSYVDLEYTITHINSLKLKSYPG